MLQGLLGPMCRDRCRDIVGAAGVVVETILGTSIPSSSVSSPTVSAHPIGFRLLAYSQNSLSVFHHVTTLHAFSQTHARTHAKSGCLALPCTESSAPPHSGTCESLFMKICSTMVNVRHKRQWEWCGTHGCWGWVVGEVQVHGSHATHSLIPDALTHTSHAKSRSHLLGI